MHMYVQSLTIRNLHLQRAALPTEWSQFSDATYKMNKDDIVIKYRHYFF